MHAALKLFVSLGRAVRTFAERFPGWWAGPLFVLIVTVFSFAIDIGCLYVAEAEYAAGRTESARTWAWRAQFWMMVSAAAAAFATMYLLALLAVRLLPELWRWLKGQIASRWPGRSS